MAIVIAVVSSFIYTGSIAIQQLGNLRADRKQGPAVIRVLTTPLWLLGLAARPRRFRAALRGARSRLVDPGAGRSDVADRVHAAVQRVDGEGAAGAPRARRHGARRGRARRLDRVRPGARGGRPARRRRLGAGARRDRRHRGGADGDRSTRPPLRGGAVRGGGGHPLRLHGGADERHHRHRHRGRARRGVRRVAVVRPGCGRCRRHRAPAAGVAVWAPVGRLVGDLGRDAGDEHDPRHHDLRGDVHHRGRGVVRLRRRCHPRPRRCRRPRPLAGHRGSRATNCP